MIISLPEEQVCYLVKFLTHPFRLPVRTTSSKEGIVVIICKMNVEGSSGREIQHVRPSITTDLDHKMCIRLEIKARFPVKGFLDEHEKDQVTQTYKLCEDFDAQT